MFAGLSSSTLKRRFGMLPHSRSSRPTTLFSTSEPWNKLTVAAACRWYSRNKKGYCALYFGIVLGCQGLLRYVHVATHIYIVILTRSDVHVTLLCRSARYSWWRHVNAAQIKHRALKRQICFLISYTFRNMFYSRLSEWNNLYRLVSSYQVCCTDRVFYLCDATFFSIWWWCSAQNITVTSWYEWHAIDHMEPGKRLFCHKIVSYIHRPRMECKATQCYRA